MPQQDEIHLYTLCWNDSRMLPHFFRHYSSLVDKFFVFDNGSTDGSLQLLAGNERVQVSHFPTEFDSFADTELRLSEEMWKNSKGLADWVIVVDIDEHVYHEDLRSYLRICRQRGITAIQAFGYEMISETFPDASMPLCDVVTNGVRTSEYCKLCLFDASAITRTNFSYGRHSASPQGRVKWPAVGEVLLLHYKKLGVEYEIARSAELKTGLRARDIERNLGYQYLFSAGEITERFKSTAKVAKRVPRTARELWEEELARLESEIRARDEEGRSVSAHATRCEAELHTTKAQLAAADLEASRLRDNLISRDTQNRDLEAQVAALCADLSVARRDLATTQEKLVASGQALSETVQLLQAERARLGNEIQARDAEVHRVSAHAARCEAELDTTKAQLAAADLEAARLRDHLISRGTQKRDLEARAAGLRAELSGARRALSKTRKKLKANKRNLSETAQQLQVLLQSRSWRITQPLRSARDRVERAFRRPKPATDVADPPNANPPETDAQPVTRTTSSMASPAPLPTTAPTERHPAPRDATMEIATGVRMTRVAPLSRLKRELETAMCSKPDDWTLRHEYFALLGEMSRSHLGSFYASLPEIATPLMLRASSSDIWNLRQIFLEGDHEAEPYVYGDYAFAIPPPRRILDLGAYCGYTAVYLANRFPDAEITCVEPPGANFEALRVNTAPYANIRCFAAAVWPVRTTLQWSGPVLGDWGNQFAPAGPGEDGAIPAYGISDILAMRGWDGADFVKCVVEGVQVETLTAPGQSWLDRVSLVATKPPKGVWPNPDDESRLFAAFPDDTFERITNRNMVLAFRRRSNTNVPQLGDRLAVPLVPAAPGLRAIQLANIDDRFGFYKFDNAGLSLTPNPPGTLPASFACRVDLNHHERFLARVISGPALSPSSEVTITLAIGDPLSGAPSIVERVTVSSATNRVWSLLFTPLCGAHEVTISAELAGPHTPDERIPWVRIVDAQFL